MSLLVARGITKSFGTNAVLRGVDLVIEKGSFTTVLGRSGCGKSVLMKCIVGLQDADSGQVEFDGIDVSAKGEDGFRELRRRVGMLFQNSALFDSMTVGENVAYGLREQGQLDEPAIGKRVEESLSMVQLPGTDGLMPSELSGGMRKRVSLARAIAMRPEVVIYDEPTEGLDPVNVTRVYRLLDALRREVGITTIVVTHNMEAAFHHSERLVAIHAGKVVHDGTPAQFRALARDEIVGPFVRASYSAVERAEGLT